MTRKHFASKYTQLMVCEGEQKLCALIRLYLTIVRCMYCVRYKYFNSTISPATHICAEDACLTLLQLWTNRFRCLSHLIMKPDYSHVFNILVAAVTARYICRSIFPLYYCRPMSQPVLKCFIDANRHMSNAISKAIIFMWMFGVGHISGL